MVDTALVFDLIARDRASATFARVGMAADTTHSKFLGMAVKGAAAMGVLTAATGVFLFKAGAPYVASLNQIQALSGANNATMKATAKQLESNSGAYAKFGQTTGDAASGVVELVKAGMSLKDAMKAVYGTMTLAKAGSLSVADASNITANALNTFHLSASKAGDVANYLANAANISSADVSDIADSFKYVAPVAASAGIKMQQVSAVLAELANNGIKASSAGTGFRKFLLSITAPSKAATSTLGALGVKVFDSAGKMKPLSNIIDQLSKSTSKLSDANKSAYMKNIFGSTGIAAAQTILDQGSKGLATYTKGVMTAGAAERLAMAQTKGLAGTFSMMKASVVSAAQAFYRQFSPIVDKALQPVAKGLANLAAGLPNLSQKLASVFSGGSGGGKMAAELMKTGTALKSFFAGLVPTLSAVGHSIMGAIGPGLKQVSGMVSTQLLPAFRQLLPILQPVAGFLLKMFGGAVVGVIKGTVNVIVGLGKAVSGVFNLVSDLVHGRWRKIWGDLKQIVSGVIQAVKGALEVWWNAGILSIFRKGFQMLTKGIWERGWHMLVGTTKDGVRVTEGLVGKGMSAITGLFNKGMSAVGRVFTTGFRNFVGMWKSLFSAVRGIVSNGWQVLNSAFGGAMAAIRTMVSQFFGAIRSIFSGAVGMMSSLASKAWAAVRGAFTAGINGAVSLVKALPGKITGALGNLGNLLAGAGRAVIQGLINGIQSMVGNLMGIASGIAAGIKNKITGALGIHSPSTVMHGYGVNIMEGLIKGIQDHQVPMQRVLDAVVANVKAAGTKLHDAMSARNQFASGFSSFGTSVFGQDLSHTAPDTVDANGNTVAGAVTPESVGDILAFQKAQAAKAAMLRQDVAKLVKLGLSPSLIKQMQSGGDAGMQQIMDLSGASKGQISQLNALNYQTNRSLGQAGMTAANSIYGDTIAQDKRDDKLAKKIAQAVKDAMHEAGKNEHVEFTIKGNDLVATILKNQRHKGVKAPLT